MKGKGAKGSRNRGFKGKEIIRFSSRVGEESLLEATPAHQAGVNGRSQHIINSLLKEVE